MGNRARRWIRRTLLVAVPAAAAHYLVLGGEYTAMDLRELRGARAAAVARVDSLQAVLDSLRARAAALEDDTLAIERLARERYGYLRDGERLYRFVEGAGEDAGGGGSVDGR